MNHRLLILNLNEGTNSLITSESGQERWFVMKNSQWLVLRNGGAYLLHRWYIDSIYSKNVLGL